MEAGLDQYAVEEYLQRTDIVAKLERALNAAAERGVEHVEAFVADYLSRGPDARDGAMLLKEAKMDAAGRLTYVIQYMERLWSFSYAVPPDVARSLGEPADLPVGVLETLYDVDL